MDGVIFEQQRAGGINRVFSSLLPAMCELDPEPSVSLLVSRGRRHALPSHKRIECEPVPDTHRFLRPTRLLYMLQPLVRSGFVRLSTGPDAQSVWHSTHYTFPPHNWKGPVVVTVHDLADEHHPECFASAAAQFVRRARRHAVLQADAVVAISAATANDISAVYGLPRNRVKVVHNACDPLFLEETEPSPAATQLKPYVLFVGARWRYKNFDGLLRAFAQWSAVTRVRLVVVGPKWSSPEQRMLATSGAASRISLVQYPTDVQLRDLYAGASAFVLPSLYEGFGIPLLEAMACGCPIVASDLESTREVAGDLPIYFNPAIDSSLVDALDAALEADPLSERVRDGRHRARAFSWTEAADSYLRIYRSLGASDAEPR